MILGLVRIMVEILQGEKLKNVELDELIEKNQK